MYPIVTCTAHITIKFETMCPEGMVLSEEMLRTLEKQMQGELTEDVSEHLINETDQGIDNLQVIIHVDIAEKE